MVHPARVRGLRNEIGGQIRELLLGPLMQRTPTPSQDAKEDLVERRQNGKQSFKPKEIQLNLKCRKS